MYELKVNIRAQQERELRDKKRQEKEANSRIQALAGHPPPPRKRKGLNFHEPGAFVAQAEQLRKKAKLEALQKKIAERAAKTGISDAVKLASLATNKVVEPLDKTKSTAPISDENRSQVIEEEIPDVEWWDKPLLRGRPLDEVILRLEQQNAKPEDILDGVTNLIEHPAIKKPPGSDNKIAPAPIFLTKSERKKLRRQNRKNAALEKQEKIKLGLIPKPEPKLKKSNIMYTLANEAIIQPSKAEQTVKEQVERRLQAHIEHNEAKKLTLEEKRAKKLRKIQEDLDVVGTWVSVFRILDLSGQAHKFKITQNARQLTMTGVLIIYEDLNLVVVEGGPKQQRKFKHLMLDRIKWNSEPPVESDEKTDGRPDEAMASSGEATGELESGQNKCSLVWEGQVSQRKFRGFKVKPMKSSIEAREFFKGNEIENYWDIAVKMKVLESMKDNTV